jgi:hypothetical protein
VECVVAYGFVQAVFNFCHGFKDIEQTRREWPQLYIM